MGGSQWLAFVSCSLLALSGNAWGQESLSRDVLAKSKGATVYVKTKIGPLEMTGSGVVIQLSGDVALIATNNHVISKPKELKAGGYIPGLRGRDRLALLSLQRSLAASEPSVTAIFHSGTPDERAVKADVVGSIEEPDLAILKVTGLPAKVGPLDYTKSPEPLETMGIFVVGFPFGDSLSIGSGNPAVTIGKGTVSSIRRDDSGKIVKLQIDGSLNPGNSGGPLIDARGNLMGIAVQTIQGSNIGLAIPTTELAGVLRGRVGRPTVVTYNPKDGAPARFEVVVPVMDPLKKLKGVTVQYIDAAVPQDQRKPGQSLSSAANVKQMKLVVSGSTARADLPLALPEGNMGKEVTIQPVFTNEQGQIVVLDSALVKVRAPDDISTTITTNGKSTTLTQVQKGPNGTSKRQVTITQGPAPTNKELSKKSKSKSKPADDEEEEDAEKTVADEKRAKSTKSDSSNSTSGKKSKSSKKSKDEEEDKGERKYAWTSNLKNMKRIPDEEVTGMVDGLEFTLDRAVLSNGRLTLREGSKFFADKEIDIVLWVDRGADVSGMKFTAAGQGFKVPVTSLSVMRPKDRIPRHLEGEVLLYLEFGDYDAKNRIQPGKIYVCSNDRAKSYVVGSFEAEVD